jgi:hypothetical protein
MTSSPSSCQGCNLTKAVLRVVNPLEKLLFIWGALMLLALPAQAWNNVGHRTIAELAWRQMDQDTRRYFSELLQQHPHYQEILAAKVPAGVDTNEWVFLTAAVWPDLVRPAKKGQSPKPRSITKYNLHPHAIGYPFLRPGDTNQALLKNFVIAEPNAEMVLASSLATLNNVKARAADRAVGLCWVLHLFGDLHQPLHAATRVTQEKPGGEGLGGNYFVLDSHGQKIHLHAFWDQLPGVNPAYQTVATLADSLSAAPDLKPTELPEYRENKSIASWVQESHRAAVDFAYAEERLQFPLSSAYASGEAVALAPPALKPEYIEGAKKIAHRRLVLAAQRLTDELKQVR